MYLLIALVENHVWTADEGLAYVQRVPTDGERAEALIALAPYLSHSSDLLKRVLAQVQQITKPEEAAAIMTSVRPTDDTATWAELGGTPHKTVATLRAMLHTLIAEGHLDPALAPAAVAPPT